MSVLRRLLESPAEWLDGAGEERELVLSCRVRLARNIEKVPFPHRTKPATRKRVLREAKEALG